MLPNKYKFDRNDHGSLYIEKAWDEDISLGDANRVIVDAEDVVEFLHELMNFVTKSKLL